MDAPGLRRSTRKAPPRSACRRPEGDWLEAVLINTAGGMTGGDRLSWQVDIGEEACAVVTTQACEKALPGRAWPRRGRSPAFRRSRRMARLAAAGNHRLRPCRLPAASRCRSGRRRDRADRRDDAVRAWRHGGACRAADGSATAGGSSVEGRLVHAEDFSIQGDISGHLARNSVTGSAVAISTVLLVGPDADHWLDPVRALIGEKGGASAWTVGRSGKLLARLYDDDGYCLRKRLVPLLALLNGRAGLPKTWSL